METFKGKGKEGKIATQSASPDLKVSQLRRQKKGRSQGTAFLMLLKEATEQWLTIRNRDGHLRQPDDGASYL